LWGAGLTLHVAAFNLFVEGCVGIKGSIAVPYIYREEFAVGPAFFRLWCSIFFLHLVATLAIICTGAGASSEKARWRRALAYCVINLVVVLMLESGSKYLKEVAAGSTVEVYRAKDRHEVHEVRMRLIRAGYTLWSTLRDADGTFGISILPTRTEEVRRAKSLLATQPEGQEEEQVP
ncbi:MAG: hypothetical protein V3T70_07190, partial [Phycisphaerae bacterium]